MEVQLVGQYSELIDTTCALCRAIQLLDGNDIGLLFSNQAADTAEVKLTVHSGTVVDIVADDLDARGRICRLLGGSRKGKNKCHDCCCQQ